MIIETFSHLDKSKWGDGPWQSEPDKAYWVDEKTGLDCLIVRNNMGGLCGYVGVKPGHKYYEQGYDNVDVEVHGGLTFSDHCDANGKICHPTESGKDKVWWLGFDCVHFGDFCPKDNEFRATIEGWPKRSPVTDRYESYKDFTYVKNEVMRLAEQLV